MHRSRALRLAFAPALSLVSGFVACGGSLQDVDGVDSQDAMPGTGDAGASRFDASDAGSSDAASSDAALVDASTPTDERCAAPLLECGKECTDARTDPRHCGNCETSCDDGEACSSGACVLACPETTADCGGACVILDYDPSHCGACGHACGNNEFCFGSTCRPPTTEPVECFIPTIVCGSRCADTASDREHCGACGHDCNAGESCVASVCTPTTSEWLTFQGDVRHRGENLGETAGPPATSSWTVTITSTPGSPTHGVVVSAGRVFVTAKTYLGTPSGNLFALDASSGATLWSYNFGNVFDAGWPALSGDTVFVQKSAGVSEQARMLAFDTASGALRWSTVFSSQFESYLPPIVADGRVYANGGAFGGLYGFDAITGVTSFFNAGLLQSDEWSPSYADGVVYGFAGKKLTAHQAATGTTLWTWSPGSGTIDASPAAAVLTPGRAIVVVPPNLIAIDLVTHVPAWTRNGSYEQMAVVNETEVIAASGVELRDHDLVTGGLRWSATLPETVVYPPVLAAGYAYVSSPAHVYAVSLATHQVVWTADGGGWLTVAAGRLFVARANGTLTAHELSPAL